MIWGEFVTQIRNLHLEFIDQLSISPKHFQQDIELHSEGFPFPQATDDYGDWAPLEHPDVMQEALEFHPVERVLLEGPLMPIQVVDVKNEQWDPLFQALLKLETEWFQKARVSTPERLAFLEQSLRAKFLQLQRRSGRFGLKAL